MTMLLAGLWARRVLNAAALLVILVAAASAVLGPMYGRAAGEHLVDTRLAQRAPYTTGLSFSVPALRNGIPPRDPDAFVPPAPGELVEAAAAQVDADGVRAAWPERTDWLLDRGPTITHGEVVFEVPLYWRAGMCDLAEVDGRCPATPDEALMQETMARTLDLGEGDTFEVSVEERFLTRAREDGRTIMVERTRVRPRAFTLVGTYRVSDPESPAWFDLSRFTGLDNLVAPPPSGEGATPSTPALLVDADAFASQTFRGGIDRAIDPAAVDLDTLDDVEAHAVAFQDRLIERSTGGEIDQLDLTTVFDEVRAERTLLSRSMLAALAPLVVLALLLLFALVSAGAAVRRPHVALAKLRGHSGRQVFGFAVGEPFLVVLLAAPLALGLAVLAAHVIAGVWLTPGIPVVVDGVAWLALGIVIASALVASTVAALDVIREPLSRALAGSLSTTGSGRVGLVLRSAVVAVAVAAVVQLLTSGQQSSQLLALLAPLLVALAVAIGGARLLRLVSAWWVRRTSTRRGTPAYLASRRLARRTDLANLMMPLLLAVSVIAFAATASEVSDEWRVSRARADVGAAQAYQSEVSPGRLLAAARAADPDGRYLAAAVVDTSGDRMGRRLLLDTTRLDTVVAWDEGWSDVPVAEITDRLQTSVGDRLRLEGSSVSISVADVALRSGTQTPSTLWLQYVDEEGEQRNTQVGPLRNGARERTLTVQVTGCDSGCLVEQLVVSGGNLSVLDANGHLALTGAAVDGRRVDWGLDDASAWRPARPFTVSVVDAPIEVSDDPAGLRLDVHLGGLPDGELGAAPKSAGYGRITPATTPDVQPVAVTSATETERARRLGYGTAIDYPDDVVLGVALNGERVPMDVVATVSTLPGVGSEGSMADLETSLVEFEPPAGSGVIPQLWVAPGTPASVLDQVRDTGVPLRLIGDLDTELELLRADAFSLGLRLFLLVGLATLLLAVFGVLASAVLQSRWRSYEVASLRVVGVSSRTLVRASVLEYVVMLGVAVVLGVVSAMVSVRLVLPTLSLGTADDFEPAPAYGSHLMILGGVGLALFVVAAVIALLVSRRTTRLGRPATLRWAEQG